MLFRGGEVAASVADVAAPAIELTPAVVQKHRSDIAAAQLLILDANLQAATLEAAVQIAAAAGVPVMFEPVSVPKAPRCVDRQDTVGVSWTSQQVGQHSCVSFFGLAALRCQIKQEVCTRVGSWYQNHHYLMCSGA